MAFVAQFGAKPNTILFEMEGEALNNQLLNEIVFTIVGLFVTSCIVDAFSGERDD